MGQLQKALDELQNRHNRRKAQAWDVVVRILFSDPDVTGFHTLDDLRQFVKKRKNELTKELEKEEDQIIEESGKEEG
jgi:hypothetical protein